MTPEMLDMFGKQHANRIPELVRESGRMQLGANIVATFHHERGPVPPTIVALKCQDRPATDTEWLTGMVRGGVHAARAIAAVCFGIVNGLVVVAYERKDWRQVWSAPYAGGHELADLVAGEVPGAFEGLMVEPLVHILHHGRALCGKPGVPGSWEPGHLWIGLTELDFSPKLATCPTCKATLSLTRN